jgi:hypothetical protein
MKIVRTTLYEISTKKVDVFYHGGTDKNLNGKHGIHIGTYEACKQALNARIGVPLDGDWDGTKVYGKTLLRGKNTLSGSEATGYNCDKDVPDVAYYPSQRNELPKYSDGSYIDINCLPTIFPVVIVGKMSNSQYSPHSDTMANSLMYRSLKKGNAKSGFYYINDAEDEGSISAVVPDKSFLKY